MEDGRKLANLPHDDIDHTETRTESINRTMGRLHGKMPAMFPRGKCDSYGKKDDGWWGRGGDGKNDSWGTSDSWDRGDSRGKHELHKQHDWWRDSWWSGYGQWAEGDQSWRGTFWSWDHEVQTWVPFCFEDTTAV